MQQTKLAISAALLTLTLCSVSSAQEAESGDIPFFGVSLGVKGAFGGNFLTDPEDVPAHPSSVSLVYESGAGGIGGGGGIYTEFRILKGHLGLEFDVLFEGNKNWSSIEYNGVVDTDWIYRFNTVRLPLLLEGSLEGDKTRVSLGVGPEFVVGTSSSTDIEITSDTDVPISTLSELKSNFRSRDQTDTFLCVGLGLAFKVWKLAITLDLRYAYNLTQTKDYMNRMNYSSNYTVTNVAASSSMDMRLMLGIAYELSFNP